MKSILFATLTTSFMTTTAICDITVATSGSVIIESQDFVGGKARYFIRQGGTTTAAIRFAGESPGDAIYQIYVLPRLLGNGISRINISFSEDDASRTVLDAVERITVENPSTTKVEIVNFNITGDVGAPGTVIDVAGMTYINASGDMYADVIVDNQLDSTSTPTNSITISGSWLDGGFYQNSGSIGVVDVGGDISGASIDPIEIWSKSSIGAIEADSITNARIGSQTNGFSGFSAVTSITTTSGDFVSSAPMTMASLGGMNIDGDFDADITVNGPMSSSATTYRIGENFASTAILSLPANGLLGTILINTDNASGQFLGDIEVGSTVLSPNYTTLSSALGNGAAGLAPYNFHQFTGPAPSNRAELSCNPHHQESVQVGDCGDFDELNEVIIEHYGPIYAVRVNGEQDTDPQFRVEFLTAIQPLPNGTPWENVTHLF